MFHKPAQSVTQIVKSLDITRIDSKFTGMIVLSWDINTINDAEILEFINRAYQELERSRAANASSSLINVLEEDIKELELIFATSDAERMGKRALLDQCAEKFDK